jgi:putative flavoprotein involved in K+ transport
MGAERFDTVVIGGGQAGLATGYHLRRAGQRFLILDTHERVGDAWRRRWDSLRLFTPAKYCAMPGMALPGPAWECPTKDEMADYLESYAERFALPLRTRTSVEGLSRDGDHFVVRTSDSSFHADNVIVTTGAYGAPRIPAFARDLDASIVQLHSSEYRNPSQLRDGPVLVVGAGNSGADISLDVVRTHRTWLSGPDTGHIPVDIDTWVARHVAFRIIRFNGLHIATIRTRHGRKAIEKDLRKADMLVRIKPKWLLAAGVERLPRTVAAEDGKPMIEDGRVLEVANVLWCTGFRRNFSWIDLPIFDEQGEVTHEGGIALTEPGLGFVGLPGQYSAASAVLPGVARDARYVVQHLVQRRAGSMTPVAV